MKKWNYNAIDNKTNQKCNGIISAETIEEAIFKLLVDNKFVISVQELSESMELAELRLQNLKALKNKLNNKVTKTGIETGTRKPPVDYMTIICWIAITLGAAAIVMLW